MSSLWKNPRVLLMLAVVLFFALVLLFKGPVFGVDFGGGTLFQIHLAEKVSDSATKEQIRSIIQQRLDFAGMKDSTVQFVGAEFVFAQLAETDPQQVERLESVLLKQGKFEAILDGNLIFSGNDFIDISKDPARGYGVKGSSGVYTWTMPFTLTEKAARRFTEMAFHRCQTSGFDSATGKVQYECDNTYFFLDRPSDSVLLIPKDIFTQDSELLSAGSRKYNIPAGLKIEEILLNSSVQYLVVDENGFAPEQVSELQSLAGSKRFAIVHPEFPAELRKELEGFGFTVDERTAPQALPWVWFSSGLKESIRLSESVANLDPFVPSLDSPNLQVYSSLVITGSAPSSSEAQDELKSLSILLESGSLPVAVDNVSKVTVTASLGKSFLYTVVLIGLIAAFAVAFVLFLRYRIALLVLPMMFTVFAEAAITLGIASLLSWPLDLAAIAGVVAAVGYGVNDQIIITDELKKHKGEVLESTSLVNRAKRSFFIILAAASTVIAVMLPLLLIGPGAGMARLVGFAFTTVVGVLGGVLITRPAFQEMAKVIVPKAQ
ncbi:MAG TPA: hypothetical protein HA227_01115 [Candidatus Diapherotrites archaeon]|uniref:Protein export membrane protein SecD/SecF C-terminal domain-containing protein n=1 Tax=Candidatus Iainarchaeum sp. TaxID=3101447 RepID=A0A7J4KUK6_9ARCH|nr:hypothetical protein [Candidatus Diapherotrites archaeon]